MKVLVLYEIADFFKCKYPTFYKIMCYVKIPHMMKTLCLFTASRFKKYSSADLDLLYDRNFYSFKANFISSYSKAIAKVCYDKFHPQSVIDVGCGQGFLLHRFKKRNIRIRGIEGSSYAIANSVIDSNYITKHDLRKPFSVGEKFDLCFCLEVAEHLPEAYATVLISTLTSLSNLIVFSAAAPGQGGTNHINEKPKRYWIGRFDKKSFGFLKELTEELQQAFRREGDKIPAYLCNNVMVFSRL